MKKNVGTKESRLRIAGAVVAIVIALFLQTYPATQLVLALVAAILAGTAYTRYCPLNQLLGRDSSDTAARAAPAESVQTAAPESEKPSGEQTPPTTPKAPNEGSKETEERGA